MAGIIHTCRQFYSGPTEPATLSTEPACYRCPGFAHLCPRLYTAPVSAYFYICLCSKSKDKKSGQPVFYISAIAQHSWNEDTKTGSFAGNSKNPEIENFEVKKISDDEKTSTIIVLLGNEDHSLDQEDLLSELVTEAGISNLPTDLKEDAEYDELAIEILNAEEPKVVKKRLKYEAFCLTDIDV